MTVCHFQDVETNIVLNCMLTLALYFIGIAEKSLIQEIFRMMEKTECGKRCGGTECEFGMRSLYKVQQSFYIVGGRVGGGRGIEKYI